MVAPVTLETFDPLVVQVEAAIVIVAVSGLVPPFCSGGSKVTVPVPEQMMLPVATVGALVDELVDVELLVVGDVEVDVEPVVGLWLLAQAGTKTKETTNTTPATARDRLRSRNRIRGNVRSTLGSIQRLSSHETRTSGREFFVELRQRRVAPNAQGAVPLCRSHRLPVASVCRSTVGAPRQTRYRATAAILNSNPVAGPSKPTVEPTVGALLEGSYR